MLHAGVLAALGATQTALLEPFRVVLVGPSQAGNVGMVSRSCANFECPSLHLVAPEYDRADPEAERTERTFAVHEAQQRFLREAPVHGDLSDALSGCVAAVGFTRRRGVERSDAANAVAVGGLAALAEESGGRVALVFGREASGLRSSELLLCTHVCEIATSASQGSLSLPAAVNFALGRAFEEALAGESRSVGSASERRTLGGDLTSRHSALLRPPSLGTGGGAGGGGGGGVGGAEGGVLEEADGLAPAGVATVDETEAVLLRWERMLAQLDGAEAAPAAGGGGGGGGGVGGHDVTAESGWVRTARGSRPATAHGRTMVLVRRLLQRARPSSRDLRVLHGVLSALEGELHNR